MSELGTAPIRTVPIPSRGRESTLFSNGTAGTSAITPAAGTNQHNHISMEFCHV